jgi:hypothetical protein
MCFLVRTTEELERSFFITLSQAALNIMQSNFFFHHFSKQQKCGRKEGIQRDIK